MSTKLSKPIGRKEKGKSARAAALSLPIARPRAPDGDGAVDRHLFDRFENYVAELYDPENATGVLGPSIYPHQAAARRKPFDITHSSTAVNEVVIYKMYPRLSNTVMASVEGVVPAPANTNVLVIDFEGTIPAGTTAGGAIGNEVASGGEQGGDFELPLVRETIATYISNSCACSTPAGVSVPLTLINLGQEAIRVAVLWRDAVTFAWSSTALVALAAGQSLSTATVIVANGIDRFSVRYRNGSVAARSAKISVMINSSNTNAAAQVLTYPPSAYKSYSVFTDAQDLDELMVRAMSMRLTCMGDLTTVGGRVACALVPREFVPDSADPVGSIAQLPTGAWDGKLEDGCHIMWQPRQSQDFSFQAPEFDDRSHYLIIAVLLAKVGTPIRLKCSFNYEIFSLDPALGAMAWCPSGFGLLEVLCAVFSAVPPGSSNDGPDGHVKKRKGALAAIARLAKRGANWVIKNPAEAAALAVKAAAMIALV